MQLSLVTDPLTQRLRRSQTALIAEFGRIIRPDDKRRNPAWTLVQCVIGARTKTAFSNANTDRLLAHFGSWIAPPALSARLVKQEPRAQPIAEAAC